MPIYEYQCDKCGHHLEALQKISDKPLRECPECGKHTLKRLVSAPLFRLAGSGWYETDFKSDKEQKRNLLDKGDSEPAKAEDKKATPKPPKTATPDPTPKPVAAAKPAAGKSRAKASARKPAARKAPAKRGR
ncbi:MAG: zinc ribbon domain-containing protein [Steroidobacteraceae bacterium]